MRIVFLTPSGEMGGAERSLLDVAASLRAARPAWPLALVAPAAGPLADEARTLGIAVRILPFPPRLERLGDADAGSLPALAASLAAAVPAAAAYTRRLHKLLGELRPDVVHSNGLKTHLLSALARPRAAALLWHLHDYAGGRPAMARLLRLAAPRCDVMVANSASVRDDARRVLGADIPVHVVYNAVDLRRFAPGPGTVDLDAAAGLPPAPAGTVRIGLVATMGVWKGHDCVLRALALLPAESRVR
ncbi:MAG TPA: glycosyltransferase, partial [Longimicrobiaceae bacterium]|nr:glycosyltransferase [Longimicrobiaceae bacterium]